MTVLRLRAEGLFWRETGEEVVVLDGPASSFHAANRTAAPLWKRLAGGATRAELETALRERYGVAPGVAAADVAAFVAELEARGLLEP